VARSRCSSQRRSSARAHDTQPWSTCKAELSSNVVSGLETSTRAWGGDPADWYVIGRLIPRSEWTEITDLADQRSPRSLKMPP
jgi:hypothetical protein